MTREDWMENFSEVLQEILNDKGVKQRDLADMTGIPNSTISAYINQVAVPSAIAIVKIAYALEADYFDLLDFGDTID